MVPLWGDKLHYTPAIYITDIKAIGQRENKTKHPYNIYKAKTKISNNNYFTK